MARSNQMQQEPGKPLVLRDVLRPDGWVDVPPVEFEINEPPPPPLGPLIAYTHLGRLIRPVG